MAGMNIDTKTTPWLTIHAFINHGALDIPKDLKPGLNFTPPMASERPDLFCHVEVGEPWHSCEHHSLDIDWI